MTDIRPFHLAVPQSDLDDLARRLAAVRWPEAETVDDWSQGVPLAAMRELVAYWREGYDWRACEARPNALGQFKTETDGLDDPLLHTRSPHPEALPPVLTHVWPGTLIEFLGCIGTLTGPVAPGGAGEGTDPAHHSSLPGYGFSGKPAARGWDVEHIGRAWA